MKTTIIQLEDYDNVSSIKEKLNKSPTQRVLLVWPNDGYIALKELEYLVILRYAYYLDIQVAVVLDDPIIVKLFKNYGISTFQNIPESQKKPWRKPKIITFVDKHTNQENKEIITNFLENSQVSAKQWSKFSRWIIFLIGIIAFLSLIVFLIPSATISMIPKSELQYASIPVRADPSLTFVNITGAVPVKVEKLIIEGVMEGKSTGIIRIPESYATGQVVFRNISDKRITIPEGTIVRTDSAPSKRYETVNSVSLPPRVDAKVTADVISTVGGTEGNVSAMMISIIEGDFGANLDVSNQEPITGGVDIKTFSPTEKDYDSARNKLIELLKDKAKEEFKSQFSDLYFIPDKSIEFEEITNEQRFPEVNDPAERFSLQVEAKFSGWMINKDELTYLANQILNSDIEPNYLPVSGSTKFEIDEDSIELTENYIILDLLATQLIYPQINEEDIIQQVVGKKSQDALNLLGEKYGQESDPMIKINPYFWDYLPFLPIRINLEIHE